MTDEFWLVQRLVRRTHPDPPAGFDGYFAMQYMGSSEYEWGTPAKALREMRTAGKLTIVGQDIQHVVDGQIVTRKVWFVGPKKRMNVITRWILWFGDPKPSRSKCKENPYFLEHFIDPDHDAFLGHVDAWWCFDQGTPLAWALDVSTAEALHTAFTSKLARG